MRTFTTARCLTLLLMAFVIWAPACNRDRSQHGASSGDASLIAPRKLPDGIYAVLREAATPDSAGVAGNRAAIVAYDHKYSDTTPSQPIEYLAIDTLSYVPLILAGSPVANLDAGGKTILSVTLAREQVKPLENFTRTHLGGKVAILLDGEVISKHKVRSVVTEGKLQITRCTDNVCEVLRAKLAK